MWPTKKHFFLFRLHGLFLLFDLLIWGSPKEFPQKHQNPAWCMLQSRSCSAKMLSCAHHKFLQISCSLGAHGVAQSSGTARANGWGEASLPLFSSWHRCASPARSQLCLSFGVRLCASTYFPSDSSFWPPTWLPVKEITHVALHFL